MSTRRSRIRVFLPAALAVAAVLACNLNQPPAAPEAPTQPPVDTPPPTATTAPADAPTIAVVTPEVSPPAEIVHASIPSDPPLSARFLTDRSSLALAGERRSIADDFGNGFFERPFTSQAMEYKPYLDLTRGEISAAGLWMYVILHLEGAPSASEPASYGVEIDLDLDGRGDWLIVGAAPPDTLWTTDGVRAYQDADNDVGAHTPVRSDPPPQAGDQYETLAFDQGLGPDPDAAWIRRSPANPNHIQIAFKAGLIGHDNEFLWGIWSFADPQAGWIDYQDHFTIDQAGSPLIESSYYPLRDLSLVDSSCRWGYDFNPTGGEPAACRIPPTPTPTKTPTKTPTPTLVPIIIY